MAARVALLPVAGRVGRVGLVLAGLAAAGRVVDLVGSAAVRVALSGTARKPQRYSRR